ncbi:hypothetical protein RGQ29_015826 [Quercus rubra]|uniref:Uncharacterized protein n=1 Tax=Quercus rubra TaxID=3512 RepID=A0AAN7FQA2_QUERU|nr:hypothetical protein RGQ29_015826 [Quercus rubra]
MTNLQKDRPSLSCPSNNGFRSQSHEWEKHGACSESQLDQHEYFEAALNLKKKANLLQILRIARIEPDDGFYSSGLEIIECPVPLKGRRASNVWFPKF